MELHTSGFYNEDFPGHDGDEVSRVFHEGHAGVEVSSFEKPRRVVSDAMVKCHEGDDGHRDSGGNRVHV